MNFYYFNFANKNRIHSTHRMFGEDLLELSEIEYIMIGLVQKYSNYTLEQAVIKARTFINGE